MVGPYLAFLALVAGERLYELVLSRRNAAWAFAHGGVEAGREHLFAMKLLHTGLLVGSAFEVVFLDRPFFPSLGVPMLGLAIGAQALRYWAVTSLGKRWNVRVITIPGMPPSTAGPYRFLRHPNYLAVVLEGLAIPLIHTALLTATAFTVVNAFLLRTRIRIEERALGYPARPPSRSFGEPRRSPKGAGGRARPPRAEPSAQSGGGGAPPQ
jgi:methyltransferase